jgi:hypothetical protein
MPSDDEKSKTAQLYSQMRLYLMSRASEQRVGKAGVEPARLAAHDPKSCLSANSNTSPAGSIIAHDGRRVQ